MVAKGAKRSVKVWAVNFYESFFKNTLLFTNCGQSKIRYGQYIRMLCTGWFILNCIVRHEVKISIIIKLCIDVREISADKWQFSITKLAVSGYLCYQDPQISWHRKKLTIHVFLKRPFCRIVDSTLTSLINVQSAINVQGYNFFKKNKLTGQKSSPISVQVSFFTENMYRFNQNKPYYVCYVPDGLFWLNL